MKLAAASAAVPHFGHCPRNHVGKFAIQIGVETVVSARFLQPRHLPAHYDALPRC